MPFTVCSAQLPASTPCKLAFVAEAPSDDDMDQGKPLVGASGRVFNQLLRVAGLNRSDFLVTHLFDTQVPDNDLMRWTVPLEQADPDRYPTINKRHFDPARVGPALARLEAEIAAADPTVIVPMGSAALWAFTGLSQITQARGAPMVATMTAKGRKLIPTLHPQHVIQSWKMFHVVVGDLTRAMAEADAGPALVFPKRQLWISPTLLDLKNFWNLHLKKSSMVSVDIETAARQITCIGFASDAQHAITVPFVDFRKPNRSYWPNKAAEIAAWQWVRAVLEGPQPKLFQNGPYDVFYIWQVMRMKVKNYGDDTRLLHHAIYPELPKDLGFLGASYTREGPWKLTHGLRGEGGKRYG